MSETISYRAHIILLTGWCEQENWFENSHCLAIVALLFVFLFWQIKECSEKVELAKGGGGGGKKAAAAAAAPASAPAKEKPVEKPKASSGPPKKAAAKKPAKAAAKSAPSGVSATHWYAWIMPMCEQCHMR